MTQEEKELLLKDLCARLPYGIFVKENRYSLDDGPVIYTYDYHPCIDNCKPYLRPMSSMTEEEKGEWIDTMDWKRVGRHKESYATIKTFDFYNSHRLDYRGLIPKGLAIAVTEKNNPYK